MARNLRTHGKNTVVWLLMGMLVLGLGGFGVTNFSGGSASAIGAVGQTEVSANQYGRALRAQLDALSQNGTRPSVAQLSQMGYDRNIQAQLFARAAYEESARRMGLSTGDDRLREAIVEIDAFTGLDGNFDRALYADTLSRQGLSEAEFEARLRAESAARLVEIGVTGAVRAPAAMVDGPVTWLTETRDLTWAELSEADLDSPVPAPTDADLTAFHQAEEARYTRPELRRITYASVTPAMLVDNVKLDEDSLRALYEARAEDYIRPERRMVEVLVYPDADAATAARARLDAGEVSFADLAAERGLTLSDIDRGEVTEAELGAAGPAVFAATDTGVVGPVETDLGPALVAVNALLDAREISFEEARADLRAEAALDRAQRDILELATDYQERLASGATIEDMANETDMALGTLSLAADSTEGMAGYPAFRQAALAASESDFPALIELDDGGLATLRLDGIDPPEVIALDQIRDQVAADWAQAEQTRRLELAAEEDAAAAQAGQSLADLGLITTSLTGIGREDFTASVPPSLLIAGFELDAPGAARMVSDEGRVFVVQADAIHPGGAGDEADALSAALRARLSQNLSSDLYAYYARALQDEAGLTLNPAVINAVNAQVN